MARVALSAHDETVISYNKKHVPTVELLQVIKDCMELEIEGFAPLFVDTAIVDTWGEAKASEAYTIPGELRDKLLAELDAGKWKGVCFDNPKEIFRDMIKDYLEHELVSYMEGLCQQAKSREPEVIYQLVRHDQLTHELIARFPQSKEHKKEHGKLSHYEQIRYSTEQYMLYIEGHREQLAELEHLEDIEEPEFDIDSMVDFDAYSAEEGDAADTDPDFRNINDEIYSDIDRFETFTSNGNKKYERIWAFGDAYYIDADGLPVDKLKGLRELIALQSKPHGLYGILIKYGGKAVNSNLRTSRLETENLLQYIEEALL